MIVNSDRPSHPRTANNDRRRIREMETVRYTACKRPQMLRSDVLIKCCDVPLVHPPLLTLRVGTRINNTHTFRH